MTKKKQPVEETEEVTPPTPCPFCAGTGKVAVGFDDETEKCVECKGKGVQ